MQPLCYECELVGSVQGGVRETLGSWNGGHKGMEHQLAIVQTLAGTPGCPCRHCDRIIG